MAIRRISLSITLCPRTRMVGMNNGVEEARLKIWNVVISGFWRCTTGEL